MKPSRHTRRRPLGLLLVLLLAFGTMGGGAQAGDGGALGLAPGDLRIEARSDGGYDLFVRAKPGLGSILLTETTKDPAMKEDNFAYRARDYNPVNGDELRLLNGKALPPANRLYSLISSTPRPDPALGTAFRILIPPVLVYGYPWSRSGTVAVGQGTFINIRAFARPYADYGGAFRDNPYAISIAARPPPPPTPPAAPPPPDPPPVQVEAPPPPPTDTTSGRLAGLIEPTKGSLDLVVCLDTTESMVPYIEDLRRNLGPLLRSRVQGFSSFRLGVVFFKDYWPEDYITRKIPFTTDIEAVIKALKEARVYGGGDIPEAEFEALQAAATEFEWKADKRQVILVTDAPPHPDPRGDIGFPGLIAVATKGQLELDALIEPEGMPAGAVVPAGLGVEAWFPNVGKRLAGTGGEGRVAAIDLRPEARGADLRALGAGRTIQPIPKSGLSRSALFAEAQAQGCGYLLEISSDSFGAFTQEVARLFDAVSGKELAHDVRWSAGGAVFVDGLRVR